MVMTGNAQGYPVGQIFYDAFKVGSTPLHDCEPRHWHVLHLEKTLLHLAYV
jgi:hypothetical protein